LAGAVTRRAALGHKVGKKGSYKRGMRGKSKRREAGSLRYRRRKREGRISHKGEEWEIEGKSVG